MCGMGLVTFFISSQISAPAALLTRSIMMNTLSSVSIGGLPLYSDNADVTGACLLQAMLTNANKRDATS